MHKTICLGVESTAHTFSVGIADSRGKILANSLHALSTEKGGLIPRELSEHHLQHAEQVLGEALNEAGIGLEEVGVYAFAKGPGIGPALRVGAVAARALAVKYNKPLVACNHCVAHIEIGKLLTGCKNPIVVYVSGANTQIIGYESGYYRVFGETLDIGLGNLLDCFGRSIGIGFPAGPKIDKMYFEAKKLVELPYSVKGMDLVFSGLLTAAEERIGKFPEENLAYSVMHTAYAMLSEVSERALAHTEKKELLLVGGVAASRALKEMLSKMCSARKAKLFVPPMQYCTDNGAMIAWLGILMHKAGMHSGIEDSRIEQRFRTDQQQAKWIKF